jgi:hypothetical protein
MLLKVLKKKLGVPRFLPPQAPRPKTGSVFGQSLSACGAGAPTVPCALTRWRNQERFKTKIQKLRIKKAWFHPNKARFHSNKA